MCFSKTSGSLPSTNRKGFTVSMFYQLFRLSSPIPVTQMASTGEFYARLPLLFRWKWCRLNIEIDGSKVQVTVVKEEDGELMEKAISELKSRFSEDMPVVGLYFIEQTRVNWIEDLGNYYLLVLCVKDLCLVFEGVWEYDSLSFFPKQLSDFLLDKSVYFVGFDVEWSPERNPHPGREAGKHVTHMGSDIRTLAAEVHNRLMVECGDIGVKKCGTLADLADQIGYGKLKGVNLGPNPPVCKLLLLDNDEKFKSAIYSAYHSYHIGVSLLSKLG